MFRYASIFIALLVLAGCGAGVKHEYVWTRKSPADGRNSSTTFVVRIAVNRSSRSVVWVEDVHDADGDLGRNMETWRNCSILDEQNWDCPPINVAGDEVVHISMRDGKLQEKYWGEARQFKLRRRIANFTF